MFLAISLGSLCLGDFRFVVLCMSVTLFNILHQLHADNFLVFVELADLRTFSTSHSRYQAVFISAANCHHVGINALVRSCWRIDYVWFARESLNFERRVKLPF